MNWLTDWIFELLYAVQKSIAFIIDFIKDVFYILAGIEPINVNGKKTDILSNFLLSDMVKKSFFYILLIAVVLLVVFVIIAIIRSEYANGENKKSKTIILGKAFQSFIIFLTIPFLLVAGITLSNTVVKSVNQSMNPYVLESGQEATIGGQLLVTSGYYAYVGEESERAEIEIKFITGELDYNNKTVVSQYYELRDLDFFVGILGGLVILVMFVMSSITFIQRIFDIILLYIISPISVSTIPVDDGNRFRIWKEMLIAKVLGAYGVILSMNLFFIVIPQVQQIVFFSNAFKDGIIKILFLIGGAFAVTKANLVIAQLTGNQAGGNETQQMFANMRTAKTITRTVGATALGIGGAVLGGRNFMTSNNSGGLKKGFQNTFSGSTSKPTTSNPNAGKGSRYGKMPSRFATMPLGMMKDLAKGGIVGVGKNFIPRMNNAIKGTSMFSHAQPIEKKQKDENKKD